MKLADMSPEKYEALLNILRDTCRNMDAELSDAPVHLRITFIFGSLMRVISEVLDKECEDYTPAFGTRAVGTIVQEFYNIPTLEASHEALGTD